MWFEDGKSWIGVVIVVERTKLGRKLSYGRMGNDSTVVSVSKSTCP
jgi:hypothetical protein